MKENIQEILGSDLPPDQKLKAIEAELALWQNEQEITQFIEPLTIQVKGGDYPGWQMLHKSELGGKVTDFRNRRFPYKPARLFELGQSLNQVNDMVVMFRREKDLPTGTLVQFQFGELKKEGAIIKKIDHRYVVLSDGVECIVGKHEIFVKA